VHTRPAGPPDEHPHRAGLAQAPLRPTRRTREDQARQRAASHRRNPVHLAQVDDELARGAEFAQTQFMTATLIPTASSRAPP